MPRRVVRWNAQPDQGATGRGRGEAAKAMPSGWDLDSTVQAGARERYGTGEQRFQAVPDDGEIFEASALANKTGAAQADSIHLEPA